jgi:hypothetical protein
MHVGMRASSRVTSPERVLADRDVLALGLAEVHVDQVVDGVEPLQGTDEHSHRMAVPRTSVRTHGPPADLPEDWVGWSRAPKRRPCPKRVRRNIGGDGGRMAPLGSHACPHGAQRARQRGKEVRPAAMRNERGRIEEQERKR